ncbi:MAG TPA: hypothetical protein VNC78_11730 [Actinomycetota bacterium]|nr:hypothetical protein [Actinomycetota bacterium]
MRSRAAFNTLIAVAALLLGACSNPGVNAGRQGGIAFIWFAVMLVVTGFIMWFFLGRED